MTDFRTSAPKISPGWALGGGDGERLIYSLVTPLDGVVEWTFQGIKARFPGIGTPTALSRIGLDRLILRGPNESDASYAGRLRLFLHAWRFSGHASGLLGQIAGYLAPAPPRMRVVTNRSVWYTREPDGSFSWYKPASPNWYWDGDTALWARFWVILYPGTELWVPGPDWGDAELWGGAWGTPGYTWGSTALPEHVASIRGIVKTWKPANTRCGCIIIAFDPDSFDPTSPPGAPMPDGTWGHWSIGDPRVASRLDTARYWDGV